MLQSLSSQRILGITVAATLALSASPAKAVLNLGVIAGGNMANVTSVPASTTSYGYGYDAGLALKLFPPMPIGVTVDLMYVHHAYSSSAVTSSYNQLFVPAVLDLKMGPIMLEAGGYYAMGLGNYSVAGAPYSYAAAGIATADYGLVGGLGVKLGPVMAEIRYNYGLANQSTLAGLTVKNNSADLLFCFWF